MPRYLFVFLLFVSASIAACAAKSASTASSGGGGSSGAVVMNGCKVDPAPICDSARGQEVDMGGMTADPRMVEQNSERTANIFIPIKRLDGQELFEVECGINTLHQSVTWAQIKTGPPVTDDDVKFLRARGLCSQS